MVDLSKVSTRELFEELTDRKDGKVYLECVIAGLKLQNCAKESREKAGKALLDYITGEFEEIARDYREAWGEGWWEAMKQDCVWQLDHTPSLDKLLFEYMNNTVG